MALKFNSNVVVKNMPGKSWGIVSGAMLVPKENGSSIDKIKYCLVTFRVEYLSEDALKYLTENFNCLNPNGAFQRNYLIEEDKLELHESSAKTRKNSKRKFG